MTRATRRVIQVGLLAVVAFVLISGVHLKWVPAPAIVDSIALAGSATGTVFESDVIETDATLAGLSWSGSEPDAVWVRSSTDGVVWSDWIKLGIQPDHAPDPGTEEADATRPATDPAYFGPISFLQYRIEDSNAGFSSSAFGRFKAEIVETSGRGLSLQQRLVRLVSSVEIGSGSQAESAPGTPTIVPNEAWGGPQCIANTKPRKLPVVRGVDFAIVHHAGNNGYASGQEALDLIYSFCNYHVSTRGWWDIAYNFLVDKYGTIYEGRRGSIDAQVQGGHTAGFNSSSFGVAIMGNFNEVVPSTESIAALEELLAWRMDMNHIPASGVVTVESHGSNNPTGDKWPAGTLVEFERIAGHRDARFTACPGNFCYSLLPAVRTNVAALGTPKFTLNFSSFDPVVPGAASSLAVDAPAGTAWTIDISQRFGASVYSTSGSGPGSVSWNPQVPNGPYVVTANFGALGTYQRLIQVGSYGWPFVDDEGSYAEAEILDMWNRGFTKGCDWNKFCPTGTLTRAEVATFIARAMDGESSYPAFQGYYSDVAAGQWYTGAIEFLVDKNVLNGGGGPFGVDEAATRALVIDLVIDALGETNFPQYQGYFSDVPQGQWYTAKIERAYELGIALGYPDGTFRPGNELTRQEAAAFLMRGLE